MSPTKPRSNRALPPGKPGNARIALICVGVFALMVGAAFAAVPMYKRFCQLTGYGGTVSRAEAAPGKVLAQTLVVRFDTNVRDLPWVFTPDQVSQTVHIGDTGLAFFKVTNTSDKVLVGRAAYNVAPDQAGRYFRKLECFCFTDQALKPGETREFPVVYFVDPQYATDSDTKNGPEITLSYTFFPAPNSPVGPST